MKLQLLLAAIAVLQTGCGIQSVFNAGGPAAENLAGLSWFVLILFCAIAVVMLGLLVMLATRPRGNLTEHAPVDVGGGQSWVLVGGFLIPTFILAVVFVTGLTAMNRFPLHDGHHTRSDLRITGHQWWWNVEYLSDQPNLRVRTANEIHIPVGRAVDIELASADVIHSFWVPELHGKVDLVPGQLNHIRIQAARPGVYRGQCAEFCGAQHANMILIVVAEPEDRYSKWLANQRMPALSPSTTQSQEGERLFLNRACILCHTIRGTAAGSVVGPDLTHVGARRMIASNMLANDTANLSAWITHAQSLKPGVRMPNLTEFSGQELKQLVAYLQSLR